MFVIAFNAATIAAETSTSPSSFSVTFFSILDLIYLTIYTVEFLLKVYSEPIDYWKSGYNRFDFAILVLSYMEYQTFFTFNASFVRVFRALRALRALRSVSFIRSLQVIVSALIRTISSITSVVSLLLLVMYIFAIM